MMNLQDPLCLLAHGGGQLDPRVATVIGTIAIAFGGWQLLRGFGVMSPKGGRGDGVFLGVFLVLFGYAFLAGAHQLPGQAIAGQLLIWWFALPLLLLPWFLWKLRQHLKATNSDAEHRLGDNDSRPEDKINCVLRPGEKLLWWGVPATRRFRSEKLAYVIFGLIPLTMGSIFMAMFLWFTLRDGLQWKMIPGYLIGGIAGCGFIAIGIICLLYPWKMASRLRNVVYALTDQRAIVLTSPRLLWNPVPARNLGESSIEFTPEQVQQYQKKWRDFGRTDLIFLREWRGGRSKSRDLYGFLGLDDPDEPARIINDVFCRESSERS